MVPTQLLRVPRNLERLHALLARLHRTRTRNADCEDTAGADKDGESMAQPAANAMLQRAGDRS